MDMIYTDIDSQTSRIFLCTIKADTEKITPV